jgi:hypothetical protein
MALAAKILWRNVSLLNPDSVGNTSKRMAVSCPDHPSPKSEKTEQKVYWNSA